MKKINLFFILAFEEQTNIYHNKLNKMNQLSVKQMETTLTEHYFLLSKYFNLYNFFEYKDKIEQFENAVIYHLPYGKDDIGDDVEKLLLKYKGKIPIVMRIYDAHSPIKLTNQYLTKYHDLSLSYIQKFVNNENIMYSALSYDNHIITNFKTKFVNKKFACMILRKENRSAYHQESHLFKEINIKKTYHLRENFIVYKNIDIYGRNWPMNMINYEGSLSPHFKKYNMIYQYKFNIVLENVIVDNYISEKILDTFLSLSVPVYLGSPVIEKYIPKECFVDIRDFKDNDELITYLENMPEDEYDKYIENILKYRDKIFDDFSTKNNFAKPIYKWYQENIDDSLDYEDSFFDREEQKIKDMKYIEQISLRERLSEIKQKIKLCWYQKVIK